jgi:hypothetical protein
MAKLYTLTVKNRVGGALLAVAIVGLGVVFLTVGLALLAGLAVAGVALGTGYAVYNRLRGRETSLPQPFGRNRSGLDPAMEVRPVEASVIRQIAPNQTSNSSD